MRSRFWAGVVVGAVVAALFDRVGVRPGRWLDGIGRAIDRQVEQWRDPARRRRLVRETGDRARRWMARIGVR